MQIPVVLRRLEPLHPAKRQPLSNRVLGSGTMRTGEILAYKGLSRTRKPGAENVNPILKFREKSDVVWSHLPRTAPWLYGTADAQDAGRRAAYKVYRLHI
jgi:hypothetical protein